MHYKERFIRWQQLTISQLSYTNNLILVLNIAFTGLLIDQTDLIFNENNIMCIIQSCSLFTLVLSFIFGIVTTLNRLNDFRTTEQLVRYRKLKFENNILMYQNEDLSKINAKIILNQSKTKKVD